jgi:hypothetical protein
MTARLVGKSKRIDTTALTALSPGATELPTAIAGLERVPMLPAATEESRRVAGVRLRFAADSIHIYAIILLPWHYYVKDSLGSTKFNMSLEVVLSVFDEIIIIDGRLFGTIIV